MERVRVCMSPRVWYQYSEQDIDIEPSHSQPGDSACGLGGSIAIQDSAEDIVRGDDGSGAADVFSEDMNVDDQGLGRDDFR